MLKNYVFDIFVWLCVGIPILFAIYVLLKRKPVFILLFGGLVFFSALPIGFMSELSINGCCGASNTGHAGLGYLIGGLVAVVGILIIVFRHKLARKN